MPNETEHGELAGQEFKIKHTGKDFQLTNQQDMLAQWHASGWWWWYRFSSGYATDKVGALNALCVKIRSPLLSEQKFPWCSNKKQHRRACIVSPQYISLYLPKWASKLTLTTILSPPEDDDEVVETSIVRRRLDSKSKRGFHKSLRIFSRVCTF